VTYLGKLIPSKLTTVQRDAITSPSEGEVVYNTTTLRLNLFDGSSWINVGFKQDFAVDLDSAESSVTRVFAGGRTTFTVTHNLNTLDLKPEVFRLSDGRSIGWRRERTGVNTVEVSRTGNVADGLFRILI